MSYLSMPGARIFYKKLGSSGVPLLFIHGGGCTHSDWEKQLEGLEHDHVVVACDLRGHGQSAETDAASCTLPQMAAYVGQMIYALGLDRPILVGHSYGTRVAILSAIIHPYLTRGVVFVDGSRVFTGTQARVESILAEWRDVERRFQRVSDEFLISRLPESERQRTDESSKCASRALGAARPGTIRPGRGRWGLSSPRRKRLWPALSYQPGCCKGPSGRSRA